MKRSGTRFARLGTAEWRLRGPGPLRQAVWLAYGEFRKGVAAGLQPRHNHGIPFMSDDYQGELRALGIESSPAYVRAPKGNDYVERFIRTFKEQLVWVKSFRAVKWRYWSPIRKERAGGKR